MSLHLYKSFTHAQIFADKRNLTELLPFFNSLACFAPPILKCGEILPGQMRNVIGSWTGLAHEIRNEMKASKQ